MTIIKNKSTFRKTISISLILFNVLWAVSGFIANEWAAVVASVFAASIISICLRHDFIIDRINRTFDEAKHFAECVTKNQCPICGRTMTTQWESDTTVLAE